MMIGRIVLNLACGALVLTGTLANRPPPKWWASGKVSVGAVAKCAESQMARFGQVRLENKTDYFDDGVFQIYLLNSPKAIKRKVRATIYVDGEASFAAIWMDAYSQPLGNRIWRQVKRKCGVS